SPEQSAPAKPAEPRGVPAREAVAPAGKPATKSTLPEKPPAPPAKAEVAPAKGYFLQLGAFSSEANARQLQAKAQAAGFKAAVQAVNGQHRVRVGPVAEQAKALDYQAQLKAKGFSPVLVSP
ncbi:MAG: DedD protein, partial [bacterium]